MNNNKQNGYYFEINNKTKKIDIGEIYRYKDLIKLFVIRNIKLIYNQTILGPLWIVINPILTSVVFTIIFGQIANIETQGMPHFLFYLSGTIVWNFFSNSVIDISGTFVSNANMLGKVYFPRITLPISNVIRYLVDFIIQFFILYFFIIIYLLNGTTQVSFKIEFLLLPFIIFNLLIVSLAFGLIFSSLTAKYRDLRIAINFIIQLWMYLSPVVYPITGNNTLSNILLTLNPITPIISNFRFVIFGVGELMIIPWIVSIVTSFVLLYIGLKLFNKIQRNFIDTI